MKISNATITKVHYEGQFILSVVCVKSVVNAKRK
jgi:hypothetical protein